MLLLALAASVYAQSEMCLAGVQSECAGRLGCAWSTVAGTCVDDPILGPDGSWVKCSSVPPQECTKVAYPDCDFIFGVEFASCSSRCEAFTVAQCAAQDGCMVNSNGLSCVLTLTPPPVTPPTSTCASLSLEACDQPGCTMADAGGQCIEDPAIGPNGTWIKCSSIPPVNCTKEAYPECEFVFGVEFTSCTSVCESFSVAQCAGQDACVVNDLGKSCVVKVNASTTPPPGPVPTVATPPPVETDCTTLALTSCDQAGCAIVDGQCTTDPILGPDGTWLKCSSVPAVNCTKVAYPDCDFVFGIETASCNSSCEAFTVAQCAAQDGCVVNDLGMACVLKLTPSPPVSPSEQTCASLSNCEHRPGCVQVDGSCVVDPITGPDGSWVKCSSVPPANCTKEAYPECDFAFGVETAFCSSNCEAFTVAECAAQDGCVVNDLGLTCVVKVTPPASPAVVQCRGLDVNTCGTNCTYNATTALCKAECGVLAQGECDMDDTCTWNADSAKCSLISSCTAQTTAAACGSGCAYNPTSATCKPACDVLSQSECGGDDACAWTDATKKCSTKPCSAQTTSTACENSGCTYVTATTTCKASCTALSQTECAGDATCAWDGAKCDVVKCSAHTTSTTCAQNGCVFDQTAKTCQASCAPLSQAQCGANSACSWDGTACSVKVDPCSAHTTSTACENSGCDYVAATTTCKTSCTSLGQTDCTTEGTCTWAESKCTATTDLCTPILVESICKTFSGCVWDTSCMPAPTTPSTSPTSAPSSTSTACSDTATAECNTVATCILVDDVCTDKTVEASCTEYAEEARCSKDTRCSWDTEDASCVWQCESRSTVTTCTAASPTCTWLAAGSRCVTSACSMLATESSCGDNASCKWETEMCTSYCGDAKTETLCTTTTTGCAWDGDNCVPVLASPPDASLCKMYIMETECTNDDRCLWDGNATVSCAANNPSITKIVEDDDDDWCPIGSLCIPLLIGLGGLLLCCSISIAAYMLCCKNQQEDTEKKPYQQMEDMDQKNSQPHNFSNSEV